MIGNAGQAGANSGTAREDAGRLRFDTQNDAFNFADILVEDGKRWLTTNNIHIANDYLKGNIELHVKLASRWESRKFKLVAQVAHFTNAEGRRSLHMKAVSVHDHAVRQGGNVYAALVFPRSCNAADCPQEAIASHVWLKPFRKGSKLNRDVSAMPLHLSGEAVFVLGKREVDAANVVHAKRGASIAKSLVQSVPQVGKRATKDSPGLPWQTGVEPDFADILAGLKIELFENSVVASLDEARGQRFKILDAFPSVFD